MSNTTTRATVESQAMSIFMANKAITSNVMLSQKNRYPMIFLTDLTTGESEPILFTRKLVEDRPELVKEGSPAGNELFKGTRAYRVELEDKSGFAWRIGLIPANAVYIKASDLTFDE